MELREERALDSLRRLVAGPETVPEGLDDVVGRHTEVRRPLLDHFQHRMQHAGHGPERHILTLVKAAPAVVVAEQLVRAVEEMNHHGVTRSSWQADHELRSLCRQLTG